LRYREFLLQTLPAAVERREEERKRLLNLAPTYRRAADAMAPGSQSQRSEMALFARKRMPENKRLTSLRHYRSQKTCQAIESAYCGP
jgi:hypothetical protein